MACIVLSVLICFYFAICAIYEKKKVIGEKSRKIAKIVSMITVVAPIIAMVIFVILFSFVLQGKLMERISHSIIVFSMWICALQFYKYAISYFKDKKSLGLSIIGIISSAGMAIFLTPLDRFCSTIYSHFQAVTLPLSIGIIVFIYAVILGTDQSLKKS